MGGASHRWICGGTALGVRLLVRRRTIRHRPQRKATKQLAGWGSPRTGGIESKELYAIQFQVNDRGQKYDVWVDDVAFTGCE
jgi:hypothetical protein